MNREKLLTLPGQTIQQAQQTVQRSSLFQGASFSEDGYGYSTVSTSFDGGETILYIPVESDTVGVEMLQFRYPASSISFERDSESSVALIADVWGSDVAQDYVNSRYTDEIPSIISPNHYYRGEKYGYRRSIYRDQMTGRGIYSFTVMDFSNWEKSRSGDRFCLTNPEAFECCGI